MASLFVIGTPIGNLDDITVRALTTLRSVSVVVSEDTRVTKRLLTRHAIMTTQMPWHQHSTDTDWQRVKRVLMQGQDVAYVTDAGTPGIADPGGRLVALVRESLPEVRIIPIPGPSALVTAVSISGIPMDEFLFLGFLPHKKGRQTLLREVAACKRPVVLYESVHRIQKLLGELQSIPKQVIVCRELTKQFETIYRGTPTEVVKQIPSNEVKGEFVVIIH